MLLALLFGVSIPGAIFTFALGIGIVKDGSPFRRDFWTA